MMKKLIFIFCGFLLFCSNSFAQKTDSLIKHFCNIDFNLSYEKKDIPKSFIKYYNHMQRQYYRKIADRGFDIVNPNEAFNQLDFANGLPDRRLIFGSNSVFDNIYFIYFEKGGIGSIQKYLYIIEYSGDKTETFLALSVDDDLETYSSLKSAIMKRRYRIMD